MIDIISDINECVRETHNCSSNAVCNNTKGSYNCTCKPGYEGDGDNCSPDAFCTNTHRSFNCTCKHGFTGDGENCTGSIFSGMSVLVCQQRLYLFSLVISPCYNLLLIAMQRQGWMQGRWIGRIATSPFLADLFVCFFPCYAWYRVQPGREQVFCNVIISIFCGVVRICGVKGSCSSFLNCNVLGTP